MHGNHIEKHDDIPVQGTVRLARSKAGPGAPIQHLYGSTYQAGRKAL
ncbi:hypothetical protein JOC94_000311 [Bacillus thermophilus]|uniref:Uncharacterized protein n=1 Tax=Siminovitchia thermophila TaxID=1245522 RepID=A0ABS2R1T0_9BACI|nr:hypothetical protein [Siminovitchia thermophila]